MSEQLTEVEKAILDERNRCIEIHAAIIESIMHGFVSPNGLITAENFDGLLQNIRYEFYRRALIAQYNAAGFNFPPK